MRHVFVHAAQKHPSADVIGMCGVIRVIIQKNVFNKGLFNDIGLMTQVQS